MTSGHFDALAACGVNAQLVCTARSELRNWENGGSWQPIWFQNTLILTCRCTLTIKNLDSCVHLKIKQRWSIAEPRTIWMKYGLMCAYGCSHIRVQFHTFHLPSSGPLSLLISSPAHHHIVLITADSFGLTPALGVDRLSAWPIIGADIKHFTDYRYRPFSKHICR